MECDALIPPGSNPEYELNRSRFLEYLYKLDGRDDPSHPNHSLFTGLAEQYRVKLGQQVMDEVVSRWSEFAQELENLLVKTRGTETTEESACSPII